MTSTKRSTRIGLVLGLMAFAGLDLMACNLENVPQALVVRGNRLPENDCSLTASAGGNILTYGVLDLSLGTRYTSYLIVENRFRGIDEITQFEDEDARLDGGGVTFTAAEVTHTISADVLSDAGVQGQLTALSVTTPGNAVTVPASGFAAPDEVTVMQVDLIQSNLGQALRSFDGLAQGVKVQVATEVVVVGFRGDGSLVKSAPFFYTVQICNGCLINRDTADGVILDPQDGDLDLASVYPFGVPCALGQDDVISNRYCAFFRPGSSFADDCAFTRCQGLASPNLACASDGREAPAPIVVE